MLLAVDIGNTNITSGIFKGKILVNNFKIPTHTASLYRAYINKVSSYIGRIDSAVLVSVVPKLTERFKTIIKKKVSKKIFVVGKDIFSGVKNRYYKPCQVGQDRLVNARAGYDLYNGEAIIVDFGTAITIDIVNKDKEYLGGVIAPGIELSLKALYSGTALLPKISLAKPKNILGRETRESMLSGAVYGVSSLCDGIVNKLKKKYAPNAIVIATGGSSDFIAPYCRSIDKIDPMLTLKGLMIIGEGINV